MRSRRIVMSLLGVVISALNVGAFKASALGVDPFQSFMSGMNQLVPIAFGTLYVIVNAVLLLFSLIADRHNIGIATFLNLLFFGYIAEFSQNLLLTWFGEPTLVLRLVYLTVGMVGLCFGSALYMTADLGVSTYDALANTLAYKWKVAKFQYCRIGCDVVCVIAGIVVFLVGGGAGKAVFTFVGIGTILTAFCMGPLIAFFNETVARPMLNR